MTPEPGDPRLRASVTAAIRIAAQPVDPLTPRTFPVHPDPRPPLPAWGLWLALILLAASVIAGVIAALVTTR